MVFYAEQRIHPVGYRFKTKVDIDHFRQAIDKIDGLKIKSISKTYIPDRGDPNDTYWNSIRLEVDVERLERLQALGSHDGKSILRYLSLTFANFGLIQIVTFYEILDISLLRDKDIVLSTSDMTDILIPILDYILKQSHIFYVKTEELLGVPIALLESNFLRIEEAYSFQGYFFVHKDNDGLIEILSAADVRYTLEQIENGVSKDETLQDKDGLILSGWNGIVWVLTPSANEKNYHSLIPDLIDLDFICLSKSAVSIVTTQIYRHYFQLLMSDKNALSLQTTRKLQLSSNIALSSLDILTATIPARAQRVNEFLCQQANISEEVKILRTTEELAEKASSSTEDERLKAPKDKAPIVGKKIFICHAKEDESIAIQLYRLLKKRGHDPWMDKIDLLPGQDWKKEIRKVIKCCDFFLACLSDVSVSKKGFVQAEMKFANDVLDEIPPGRIFFLPVRLDNCEPPDTISHLHRIDLFSDQFEYKLFSTIEK